MSESCREDGQQEFVVLDDRKRSLVLSQKIKVTAEYFADFHNVDEALMRLQSKNLPRARLNNRPVSLESEANTNTFRWSTITLRLTLLYADGRNAPRSINTGSIYCCPQ